VSGGVIYLGGEGANRKGQVSAAYGRLSHRGVTQMVPKAKPAGCLIALCDCR
jgi:hypothetical protein